jgi:hypothetical protein
MCVTVVVLFIYIKFLLKIKKLIFKLSPVKDSVGNHINH